MLVTIDVTYISQKLKGFECKGVSDTNFDIAQTRSLLQTYPTYVYTCFKLQEMRFKRIVF